MYLYLCYMVPYIDNKKYCITEILTETLENIKMFFVIKLNKFASFCFIIITVRELGLVILYII
jgi:hypothetical protein